MVKALFLTVGTGNKDNQNDSLFNPLRKSIKESGAGIVVFLPSQETLSTAQKLKSEFEGLLKVYIEPLKEKGMEEDADLCFTFFDHLFQDMLKVVEAKDIIVDFTRGTKVMSAALYSAGLRNKISDFRYITSMQRDVHGQVIAGTEEIKYIDASYARYLAILDQCKNLFEVNQFSAVQTLLNVSNAPKKLREQTKNVSMLAEFYTAWDRLDYQKAKEICPTFEMKETIFEKFSVPQQIQNWIKNLSVESFETPDDRFLTKEECLHNAERAFLLVFDLYGNALRRLKAGQLEDAAIRAYRMLEMIGQIKLFKMGFDSSRMPTSNREIDDYCQRNSIFKKPNLDFYMFSRKNTAEFLRFKNDPIGSVLLSYEEKVADIRNNSILIHGYKSRVDNEKKLRGILDDLLSELKVFNLEQWNEYKENALFMNKFAG